MEWVEKNVRSDMRQASTRKTEIQGVHGGSEASNVVRFGGALTKRQEAKMKVAELKMLRCSLGATNIDKIRNEYIGGTAQVEQFGEKMREERLRWYGHVRRKYDVYIGRRVLIMALPGNRKRGRSKGRFMFVVKEDMYHVEVTEEDT